MLRRQETSCDKSRSHISCVTGQTFTIQQQRLFPKQPRHEEKRFGRLEPLCMACKGTKNGHDGMHWTTDCENWKALKLPDRKRVVRCHRHLQAGVSHDPGKCRSNKMSKWYNNGAYATECGICKSRNHCAELCDQNKSITKLLKVTTMTAST